jgi:hypothetical protein
LTFPAAADSVAAMLQALQNHYFMAIFQAKGTRPRTSNIEHRTSNIDRTALTSMFGVECSVFDVQLRRSA